MKFQSGWHFCEASTIFRWPKMVLQIKVSLPSSRFNLAFMSLKRIGVHLFKIRLHMRFTLQSILHTHRILLRKGGQGLPAKSRAM